MKKLSHPTFLKPFGIILKVLEADRGDVQVDTPMGIGSGSFLSVVNAVFEKLLQIIEIYQQRPGRY